MSLLLSFHVVDRFQTWHVPMHLYSHTHTHTNSQFILCAICTRTCCKITYRILFKPNHGNCVADRKTIQKNQKKKYICNCDSMTSWQNIRFGHMWFKMDNAYCYLLLLSRKLVSIKQRPETRNEKQCTRVNWLIAASRCHRFC